MLNAEDGYLPTTNNQKKRFIQRLVDHGCYIEDQAITIKLTWTFEDIDKLLRSLFPKLFEYVDGRRLYSSVPDSPDWKVVSVTSLAFELCSSSRPNGSVLHRNKGCRKSGISDSHLWFGN